MLLDEDWICDENFFIDVSYVKTIWNCFDESALEMMLKLSDLSEGFDVFYQLQALTIGNNKCESFLKTLYALGYDKAVRIDYNDDARLKPELIAGLITRYVNKKNDVDMILMGQQTSDGNNEKTPLLTAEYLHWSCITQVIKIEPVDEKSIKVTNQCDEGIMTQIVNTPCVLSIGNIANSYLRVPTLKDRMKLGKKPIEVITPYEIGVNEHEDFESLVELCAVENPNKGREGIIIEGNSPKEKAEYLYNNYLKERLKRL